MRDYNSLLNDLLSLQAKVEDVFKPTLFWQAAANDLAAIIQHHELSEFRNKKACLDYFVPTYGFPGIALNEDQIDSLLKLAKDGNKRQKATLHSFTSGYDHFLSDYRVARAARIEDTKNIVRSFSESKIGNPIEHFELDNCCYSRSALNYINGLLALQAFDPDASLNRVMEIGGGFGSLGEILFKSSSDTKLYINLDIPPTCIFADFYLTEVFKQNLVTDLAKRQRAEQKIEDMNGIHVLPNWEITRLSGQIDLFVNFISFQEMEPHVVKRYMDEIFRFSPTYLLLRNLREGKPVAKSGSVGVLNPVRGIDYETWLRERYQMVKTDSNVFGHTTSDGFHSEITIWKHK